LADRDHTIAKGYPGRQGLYDSRNEHDSCGIGFVANIKGRKSHDIVQKGLQVLRNLTHRGAVGADPKAGDGAGILIQIPDKFFRAECEPSGISLPPNGDYGVGVIFLPQDATARRQCEEILEKYVAAEGQIVLGWRDVLVDSRELGESVKVTEPAIRQIFIGRGENCSDTDALERKLFVIRKQAEIKIDREGADFADFYVTSMSARTVLYKGMVLADQVGPYYDDLRDERVESALALVHQRFSTNTFPTWKLAQPFRMICHNGEINTVRGNINWMNARRHSMKSKLFGDDLEKVWPLIAEGQSDSACFDNALELLIRGGYSLAHAMMMLIPEAWDGNKLMDDERRAFYQYYAGLMEPWDGPAAVAFTDGRQIGATLDRNGLRPARYLVTDDDTVLMASEMGVLQVPEEKIVKKWRLQPGKMLLIDLEQGRIIDDTEIKAQLSTAHPYQEWLDQSRTPLRKLPAQETETTPIPNDPQLLNRQQAFGYSQEDLKFLMAPMAATGQEAVGSMGLDTPTAPFSDRPKILYTYFKQLFAQVTNPPIDPIREELVMSLRSYIGPRLNLLGLDHDPDYRRLEVRQPIQTDRGLAKICAIGDITDGAFRSITLDMTYPVSDGAAGMKPALVALRDQAEQACADGFNILILSDRALSEDRIAIPALLATGAVHHHLIRKGLRTGLGLVVDTGEAREVHHFALLAGYGAEAIVPYLAFETLQNMRAELPDNLSDREIQNRYIKAIGKGLLKVMSKMGISTYQSYCGAQIFDAVGLSSDFVDEYFYGTHTAIEGVGLEQIAEETVHRHRVAYGNVQIFQKFLDVGGDYAYRIRGEEHFWTPDTVGHLQHAVRGNVAADYKTFAASVNQQTKRMMTIRGLLDFKPVGAAVPIDEVEPASEIVKRFSTGAMSYGSISREAHTNLAIAMNRIGGKSNTGEGGEEADRFVPMPNGDSKRSAIKQVASGRFGVTTEYLVNSDMMQIKMAQGAKPGEGGQLPGHKVDAVIAKVRHSTPGVGLISPPPHHDIYSIEDLAQLIFDLKNVNPEGDVSVKLVSEIGVGTVAAGVAKAKADHVTISGFEGGTGASPLTSLAHAGSPWEIGLAETHQTLVLNKLRTRISVQVDGGLRTGRDVVVGALLGADEFGFATAPLIASGCIMMRKCHLNTCPVGIATQDPELRRRFTGKPEHVINYFFFVAEEVRQIMAELGFRKIDDMIGHLECLDQHSSIEHFKAKGLDFSDLLYKPDVGDNPIHNCDRQDHNLDSILDRWLIREAGAALSKGTPVQIEGEVRNTDRTVGAMLSGKLAKRYGHKGLPEGSIKIKLAGTAGQSFGAFLTRGVSIELSGDANDYVGKGLSGGRLVVYPPKESKIVPEESIIVGNTVLYGAIEGECFFRGVAGERFAVRNSGAVAVVEGVGDHGCEYMTGGIVVVIGQTGRNFAAGMSGGIAYVLDEEGDFDVRCNLAMVDLEPVPAEAETLEQLAHQGGDMETHGRVDVMRDMNRHDMKRLHHLIGRHLHYTGSERAWHILDNWEEYLPKFVKVMPVDYRRALEEIQQVQGDEPDMDLAAEGA
jgi:glutamate synthase (NADPH/NADH) large chain